MISFLPSISDTANTSTCTLSEEELYNGQFPWSHVRYTYVAILAIYTYDIYYIIMYAYSQNIIIICILPHYIVPIRLIRYQCIFVGHHSMSIQHRLQVADVYNRIYRLKEEERLLYAEMKQFIVYFKETISGRIKASIEGKYIYIGVLYMHVLTVILLLTATYSE